MNSVFWTCACGMINYEHHTECQTCSTKRGAPRVASVAILKMYQGDIPFDRKTGSLLTYPMDYMKPRWQPNAPFTDSLTFVRFERGRSAAHAILKRSTGAEVTVFLTDFEEMVPMFDAGVVDSVFVFCKRGSSYGCKLV